MGVVLRGKLGGSPIPSSLWQHGTLRCLHQHQPPPFNEIGKCDFKFLPQWGQHFFVPCAGRQSFLSLYPDVTMKMPLHSSHLRNPKYWEILGWVSKPNTSDSASVVLEVFDRTRGQTGWHQPRMSFGTANVIDRQHVS